MLETMGTAEVVTGKFPHLYMKTFKEKATGIWKSLMGIFKLITQKFEETGGG